MTAEETRKLCDLYNDEVIRKYNPKFSIKYKRESKLLKFLTPVLNIINPNFFDGYITTMFGTMWVPDNFFDNRPLWALEITAHEGLHERDRKKLPPVVFELLYLFPHWLLIPLFVLAALYSWWLLLPAFAMLLPLPAYGRYKLEMRAYGVNRAWAKHVHGSNDLIENTNENVFHQMTSLQTYWATWPFKNMVRKDLAKPIDISEDCYEETLDFLKRHDLMK